MRRSSLALILVALALLSRLLAPLAAEARAADPLANIPICSHDAGPGSGNETGDPKDGHAICDLACCHVAPLLFKTASSVVTVDLRWVLIALPSKACTGISSRYAQIHRARGPPLS